MMKIVKKIVSVCLILSMVAAAMIPAVSAADSSDGWTYVDFSDATQFTGKAEGGPSTGNWTTTERTAKLEMTSGTGQNAGMYDTAAALDQNKAYMISVDVKFEQEYENNQDDSAAVALMFGLNLNEQLTPWFNSSGADVYISMFHRGNTGASASGSAPYRVFSFASDSSKANDIQSATAVNNDMTTAMKKYTGTINLSVYVSSSKVITYMNGIKMAEAVPTNYKGGYVGIVSHLVKSTDDVTFSNLKYKEVSAPEETFNYVDTSIRFEDPNGIRVKTNILSALTSATKEANGFEVVEYGTLVSNSATYATTAMTVGADGVEKAVAFGESTDIYFEKDTEKTVYTIALHGISDSEATYYFRAYYVVKYHNDVTATYYCDYGTDYNLAKTLKGVAQQIESDTTYFESLSQERQNYITSLTGNSAE